MDFVVQTVFVLSLFEIFLGWCQSLVLVVATFACWTDLPSCIWGFAASDFLFGWSSCRRSRSWWWSWSHHDPFHLHRSFRSLWLQQRVLLSVRTWSERIVAAATLCDSLGWCPPSHEGLHPGLLPKRDPSVRPAPLACPRFSCLFLSSLFVLPLLHATSLHVFLMIFSLFLGHRLLLRNVVRTAVGCGWASCSWRFHTALLAGCATHTFELCEFSSLCWMRPSVFSFLLTCSCTQSFHWIGPLQSAFLFLCRLSAECRLCWPGFVPRCRRALPWSGGALLLSHPLSCFKHFWHRFFGCLSLLLCVTSHAPPTFSLKLAGLRSATLSLATALLSAPSRASKNRDFTANYFLGHLCFSWPVWSRWSLPETSSRRRGFQDLISSGTFLAQNSRGRVSGFFLLQSHAYHNLVGDRIEFTLWRFFCCLLAKQESTFQIHSFTIRFVLLRESWWSSSRDFDISHVHENFWVTFHFTWLAQNINMHVHCVGIFLCIVWFWVKPLCLCADSASWSSPGWYLHFDFVDDLDLWFHEPAPPVCLSALGCWKHVCLKTLSVSWLRFKMARHISGVRCDMQMWRGCKVRHESLKKQQKRKKEAV